MKYYLDITLLPDAEANLGFLWQKVYQQIHIVLADNKIAENQSAIAVSFPKYGDKEFPLGDKLRLLADQQALLEQLDIAKWLNRLTDYTHATSIKSVPSSVNEYACFKRKAVKSELKRAVSLANHLSKPVEEVVKFRQDKGLNQNSKLPFIHMESQKPTETGQKNKFRLFIERHLYDSSVEGNFDCYGLSKTATIPWF